MTWPHRIAILVHENDARARRLPYLIWPIAEVWKRRGIDVVLVHGAPASVRADVLVSHVDVTVLPEAYRRLLAAHPCVVNRAVHDVSKRRISSNLVRPDDGYTGPVIVKTDRNHGGYPDSRLVGPPRRRVRSLARAVTLRPDAYPVFSSVARVPPGVFENPHLVVERFLPERDGDYYCVRSYTRFGDAEDCQLKRGTDPTVKSRHLVDRASVSVHPQIREAARRLGIDFGKLDYVVHDGAPVLLDASITPTRRDFDLTPEARARAEERAEAALALCARRVATPGRRR